MKHPLYRVGKTWLGVEHHPEATPVGTKSVRYAPHEGLPDFLKTERLEDSYTVWFATREEAFAYVQERLEDALEKAASQITTRLRMLERFDPEVRKGLPEDYRNLIKAAVTVDVADDLYGVNNE